MKRFVFLLTALFIIHIQYANAQTSPVVQQTDYSIYDYLVNNTFYLGTSTKNVDRNSTVMFIKNSGQFMIISATYPDFHCGGSFDLQRNGDMYLTEVQLINVKHYYVTQEYDDDEEDVFGIVEKVSANICKIAFTSSGKTPLIFYLIKKNQ